MSLSPEFMSFLGRPPAAPNPAAQFVPGYAGKKWDQANQHTEKPMAEARRNGPATDLYDRIIAAIEEAGKPLHRLDLVEQLEVPEPTVTAGLKKMLARKMLVQHGKSRNTAYSVPPGPVINSEPALVKREGPKVGTAPRFGVFEDGSVQISLPKCRGMLTAEEASGFLAFVKRIQG